MKMKKGNEIAFLGLNDSGRWLLNCDDITNIRGNNH